MRKQYSDRSIYDNYLKQLDKDKHIIRHKKQKQQLRSEILSSINKMERKTKLQIGFKYISSIGVFIVFLLFGYQLLSSSITEHDGTIPVETDNNQPQNDFIIGNSNESEDKEDISDGNNGNENKFDPKTVTKEELMRDIDLRLPNYIPEQVNTEPRYVKLSETGPVEVMYLDSESYFFSFAQSELFVESKEDTVQEIKSEWYKNDVLEEFEIAGNPTFLRLEGDDTSYYSSLHIVTGEYVITITTHGIEKEEILKIANSIELTGL